MTPFIAPVKVGTKHYAIVGRHWDQDRQVALVAFEDSNGIEYETEAFGMDAPTVRQAVVSAVLRKLAEQ